jgi:transcriptional regulator with XRE-family HTH domain
MSRRGKFVGPVDDKTIAKRLGEIRRRRGKTQVEIAETLGIKQSLVSEYERGRLRLHAALVAAFAKALRVSADEILGLAKPKENGVLRDRRVLRRFQRMEDLGKRDQLALFRTIDAYLSKLPERRV